MPLKMSDIFRRHKPVVKEPAVQPQIQERPARVQPEEIRNLGDLIRKRYELDNEIWCLRDVGLRDRSVVEDRMRRSDAILYKINKIISGWDKPGAFKSTEDWNKMREIKRRIEAEGKRIWEKQPPWDEEPMVN